MSDVLSKATVLVLNRNWQAIDVKTPAQAFCMMANGNATALDMFGAGDPGPMAGLARPSGAGRGLRSAHRPRIG